MGGKCSTTEPHLQDIPLPSSLAFFSFFLFLERGVVYFFDRVSMCGPGGPGARLHSAGIKGVCHHYLALTLHLTTWGWRINGNHRVLLMRDKCRMVAKEPYLIILDIFMFVFLFTCVQASV